MTRTSPLFGMLLRRHRQQRGLRQADLAQKAGHGWNKTHISRVENGEKPPPEVMVLTIANALNLNGSDYREFVEAAGYRP